MAIQSINATTYKAENLGDVKPLVTLGGGKDPAGDYYMGAQETRSDGNVYELDLTEDRKSVETITITADGWRG